MNTNDAIKDHLLSNKERIKLDILLYLIKKVETSTKSIAAHFNFPMKRTLGYLKELSDDFACISFSSLNISIGKGFITLSSSNYDLETHYYILFNFYCKHSTNFILLSALFNKKNTTIKEVSEATVFSTSYIYKKIPILNKLLDLYGLSVNFSSQSKLIITGTEFQIHYFFLDTYWTIFLTLPELDLSHGYSTNLLNQHINWSILKKLGSVSQLKLALLLQITDSRYPFPVESNIAHDLKEHPYLKNFSEQSLTLFADYSSFSTEQKLIVDIIAPMMFDTFATPERMLSFKQYLHEQKNIEYLYIENLLHDFSSAFQLNITKDDFLYYSMLLMKGIIYNQLFVSKQPNTSLPDFLIKKDSLQPNSMYVKINKYYKNYVIEKQPIITFRDQENVSWTSELLLRMYKNYSVRKSITIGIFYSRDFYITDFIKLKIQQAFGEDINFLTKTFDGCDIVIADYPIVNLPNNVKKIYIFEEKISAVDWEDIFKQVSMVLFEAQ
ncbi:helix-turn-helix domain-containing protein [Enterococcus faecalis]|uniref:helix-turn-helix domain-containing protein n=1 Tax=Enterococcus faecalis TaxID=1351 RepID=UPI002936089E|nr:helix-turn-helix domain-containing protein [Enterococcus faecalis]MDV2933832.1 helix-turn-helix domain-containing protein [Enterococcus faecalis]